MKCSQCNTERTTRILDYCTHCIELGEFVVPSTELTTCACGEKTYFTPAQAKYVESKRNQLIDSMIAKLPIGEFVPFPREHRRNKRMLITFKVDKELLVYKPSLMLYNTEGDGRMNIVAELAKHTVIHVSHVNKVLRERSVRT